MNSRSHYDVAIIGAGLSGIAAGIRAALFGKSVCIFERHNAPGGLNSFYSLAGRKYDVGLHAVTNFVPAGVKGTALGRLLRQLRLDRDELALREQKRSRISFGPGGEASLRFTNRFEDLEAEVADRFPTQADGFRRLAERVRGTPYPADGHDPSAREVFSAHLSDPLCREMLLSPVLFYGSAWENDMPFSTAALLFRAILLEGLARPGEGIRRILRVLLAKYREAGGERRMKCGVCRIVAAADRAAALVLDDATEVTADCVLSCVGAPETAALIAGEDGGRVAAPREGAIAFVETISVFREPAASLGWSEDTIVFFNDSATLRYENPSGSVDTRSGVLCLPGNFAYEAGEAAPESQLKVTCLANYARWKGLSAEAYPAEKSRWFPKVQEAGRRHLPPVTDEALAAATVAADMFTPCTVERFTGRRGGAIYGSPDKSADGRTALSNVFLCGADQGLVGIMGALLSGVMMANRHVLRPSPESAAPGA
ncbi:MAG: phytoene desaturase family protein [Opitutaceae bacterium]